MALIRMLLADEKRYRMTLHAIVAVDVDVIATSQAEAEERAKAQQYEPETGEPRVVEIVGVDDVMELSS